MDNKQIYGDILVETSISDICFYNFIYFLAHLSWKLK
jgi:hypothetical protein